jgi:O-antigen/teichoic acid export membrane protein
VPFLSTIGKLLQVRLLRHLMLEIRALKTREGDALSAGALPSRRNRRAALGAATNMLSGGLKMVGLLVTVPLMLHYLGAERFGVWVTLTSFVALVGLGDLGIGNGLINAIAAAHSSNDRVLARIHVSSAFFMALVFSSVLLVVLAVLDAVVPWPTVFNLSSPKAIAEVGPAVKVLIVGISLNVLLGVVVKVRIGYQQVYINSMWDAVGVVVGVGALVFLIWHGASLPWLVSADAGAPIVAMASNLACLFLRDRPWLRPAWTCVSLDSMRGLFNLGILFFILQVTGIVGFYSDNLLAIRICGPEAAGVYAIAVRLFSPCRLLAGTLLSPLWPAYSEAIASGDVAWVRRTVVVSIITVELLILPFDLVLLVFGNDLAGLWLQRPISFGYGLLAGVALWVLLETIGVGFAYFLNGASAVRVQIILAITFALTAVAAKVTLANQFGIAGIIWGTIIAFSGTVLIPYFRLIPRQMRELTARAGRNPVAAPPLPPYAGGASPSE